MCVGSEFQYGLCGVVAYNAVCFAKRSEYLDIVGLVPVEAVAKAGRVYHASGIYIHWS